MTLIPLCDKIMVNVLLMKGRALKMKIEIENSALTAIERLKTKGFEGYVVGGCVRDSIMKKVPHDWDICTNALPQEISAAFEDFRVIETGIKHGTVTVLIDGQAIEITSFRIDGEYSDSRHPSEVTFVADVREDLARRDFTVNAMAYSREAGLLDFFGGRTDIENKVIRCVGEPDLRFNEDALRILRALRFSSVLGFEIEKETSESIFRNKLLLNNISAERIASELNKLLLGDNVFAVLKKYREVLAVFIPEMRATFDFEQHNKHHCFTVYDHIIKSIEASPKDLTVRLTMLLHDIGKPQCFTLDSAGTGHFKGHPKPGAEMAETILRRLKYDSETIRSVKNLVFEHDNRFLPNKKLVKSFMQKYSFEFLKLQNDVRRADCTAQSMYLRAQKLDEIHGVEELAKEIVREGECFKLSDLAVNGSDMTKLGIPEGKEIGRILNALLELVINGEMANEKTLLTEKAKELYSSI